MKTNNHIKVLCVMALAGSIFSTQAQAQDQKKEENNLNREMTLEREFDPTVQDANKVNTLPQVKEPTVKKIPIDYASYTMAMEPGKQITVLPSGNIDTEILWNKRRGYLNFGAGTYLNMNGDAGYHILSTEQDKLNIWFSHRSTNGKNKYLDSDEKIKVKLNDNLGGLNYLHDFQKVTLNLGLKYGYSSFNYYGLAESGDPILSSYSPTDGETLSQIDYIDRETNQGAQTVQANFGLTARQEEDFLYKFNIGYTNFSRKYGLMKGMDGLKESSVAADFDFSATFNGGQRIGLEGSANYFGYNTLKLDGTEIYSYDNHTDITLAPYYKIEGDSWNLKIGAKAMMVLNDDSKFAYSPNIAADVEVADKTVLYLNAGGEIKSNAAWQMSRINRYINPTMDLIPSRNYLDGVFGIKSGAATGFWFDVFAGYTITKDDVFFIPGVFTVSGAEKGRFYNACSVMQANSNRFFGGANFKYSYQDFIELGLKGVYNNWDVKQPNSVGDDGTRIAYGKPEFELNANVTLRPMKGLSASLEYYLATGRKALYLLNDKKNMNNINELNLTGNYNFNDTFGLYLKMNNVLCQKYEVYQGYPLQSFSAMIGFNINF